MTVREFVRRIAENTKVVFIYNQKDQYHIKGLDEKGFQNCYRLEQILKDKYLLSHEVILIKSIAKNVLLVKIKKGKTKEMVK